VTTITKRVFKRRYFIRGRGTPLNNPVPALVHLKVLNGGHAYLLLYDRFLITG